MQHDENTPTDGRKTEENAQNIQHVQSAAADGRPALYGRKVLSFVRRSARLDARLQRAWDTYADTYLLNINAGEGPSTCVRVSCSTKPISAKRGAIPIL